LIICIDFYTKSRFIYLFDTKGNLFKTLFANLMKKLHCELNQICYIC